MSFHSASDLHRLGIASSDRIESGFDLYRYSTVESLHIRWGDDDLGALELVLEGEGGRIVVRATGVRSIYISELAGRLFLPELEVEDWSSRGLEGIRYRLVSQTNRDFRVLCSALAIE